MTTAIEKSKPKGLRVRGIQCGNDRAGFSAKDYSNVMPLLPMYEDLVKQELTPELCKSFKELRLKMVKVRTGIRGHP